MVVGVGVGDGLRLAPDVAQLAQPGPAEDAR